MIWTGILYICVHITASPDDVDGVVACPSCYAGTSEITNKKMLVYCARCYTFSDISTSRRPLSARSGVEDNR